MTGSRNGVISLWKNNKIAISTKGFDGLTLVLFKDGSIFGVSQKIDAVELNRSNLKVVREYKGRMCQPFTIDANENNLVIGYRNPGYIDVHNRKELGRDGTHQKRMVNFFILH